MSIDHILIGVALIILCSILNHLGGQSTTIPNPRITCRVFGIGVAAGFASLLYGHGIETSAYVWGICTTGMALWAVWKWGPMFMAINGEEHRDYTTPWYNPNTWLTAVTDSLLGVNQLTTLTTAQCKNWGTIYGTFRGAFMYPMFCALAGLLSPAAFLAGIPCMLQGIVYRISTQVYYAEFIFGGIIGAMLATVLIWG